MTTRLLWMRWKALAVCVTGLAVSGLAPEAVAESLGPDRLRAAAANLGSPGPTANVVTTAPGISGETFVAWVDRRRGNQSDIYMQRLGPDGEPLWAPNGVPVCTATGEQYGPGLISDGAGGVIVTWKDARGGAAWEIYVQRFDSEANPLWNADGVLVGVGGQYEPPLIVSDGGSGAIVAWSANVVRAQHLREDGVLTWGPAGIAVANSSTNQADPAAIADGAGGIILAWVDDYSLKNIRAQRLAANGVQRWSASGVEVCAAGDYQSWPALASDGKGGAFIAWGDQRDGLQNDLFAQRVDSLGATKWTANGVGVCATPEYQGVPRVEADGTGAAVILWFDGRPIDGGLSIFAQRLSASGVGYWAGNGVGVGGSAQGGRISTCPAPQGGVFAGWQTTGSSRDIRVQRVSLSGGATWGAVGMLVCDARDDQHTPLLSPDGADGAVVFWLDRRCRVDTDLYAQRVTGSGAAVWASNGVLVHAEPGVQIRPAMAALGSGSAGIVWSEKRNGDYDVYARAIGPNGAGAWPAVALASVPDLQGWTAVTGDGSGGLVAGWPDRRSGLDTDCYLQRVDSLGVRLWPAGGVPVCTAGGDQGGVVLAPDGAHGAVAAWVDRRVDADDQVYVQRVDAAGTALWAAQGVRVTPAVGPNQLPNVGSIAIASDDANGAFIAWQRPYDYVNTLGLQHVNASGAPLWAAPRSIPDVSIAPLGSISLVPDGMGGVIVGWLKTSFQGYDPTAIVSATYRAQRFDADGNAQWGVLGALACSLYVGPFSGAAAGPPVLAPDGAGGAVLAWKLRRGTGFDLDVYAARVRPDGSVPWPATGVELFAGGGDASQPWVVADGVAGAIVAWSEPRSGSPDNPVDLFAQYVDSSGAKTWSPNGVLLCGAPGVQGTPVACSDGAGGAVVAWEDWRAGDGALLYNQRVASDGNLLWNADGVTGTLASLVRAEARAGRVRLVWQLRSTIDRVSVWRSSGGGEWTSLGDQVPDGRGQVTVEDLEVVAGGRYGYRLMSSGTEAGVLAEDWIEVPRTILGLSLRVAGPHPSMGGLRVVFTLPGAGAATLSVHDVQGRRLLEREVGALGEGSHLVDLTPGMPLPAGVYLLRLTQAGLRRDAKVVVVR